MDLIFDCVDEIALEGLDGITLNSLWVRLDSRKNDLNLDQDFKDYIWKSIILNCSELEFFQLPAPRPCLNLNQDNTEQIYPLVIINDTNKMVFGSCSTYYLRKNISDIILKNQLNLTDVIQRWGDSLCLVASQKRRELALLEETNQAILSYTYIYGEIFCILEYIGRTRYVGTMSNQICKIFNQTQHNIFNIFKKLKYVVATEKPLRHNRYYLKRFPAMSFDVICFLKFIEILIDKGENGIYKEELIAQTKNSLHFKLKKVRSSFAKFSKEFIIEKRLIENDEEPMEMEIVKLTNFSVDVEDINLNQFFRGLKERQMMFIDDSLARNIKNYIDLNGEEGRSSQELAHLLGLPKIKNFFKKFKCFHLGNAPNSKLGLRYFWNGSKKISKDIPITFTENSICDEVKNDIKKFENDSLRSQLYSFIKDRNLNLLQKSRIEIIYNEIVKKKCITSIGDLKVAIHIAEQNNCCDLKCLRRVFNYFIMSGVVKQTPIVFEVMESKKMVEFFHISSIDQDDETFVRMINLVKNNLEKKQKISLEREDRKNAKLKRVAQMKERKELKIEEKRKQSDPIVFIKNKMLKRGSSKGTTQIKKRSKFLKRRINIQLKLTTATKNIIPTVVEEKQTDLMDQHNIVNNCHAAKNSVTKNKIRIRNVKDNVDDFIVGSRHRINKVLWQQEEDDWIIIFHVASQFLYGMRRVLTYLSMRDLLHHFVESSKYTKTSLNVKGRSLILLKKEKVKKIIDIYHAELLKDEDLKRRYKLTNTGRYNVDLPKFISLCQEMQFKFKSSLNDCINNIILSDTYEDFIDKYIIFKSKNDINPYAYPVENDSNINNLQQIFSIQNLIQSLVMQILNTFTNQIQKIIPSNYMCNYSKVDFKNAFNCLLELNLIRKGKSIKNDNFLVSEFKGGYSNLSRNCSNSISSKYDDSLYNVISLFKKLSTNDFLTLKNDPSLNMMFIQMLSIKKAFYELIMPTEILNIILQENKENIDTLCEVSSFLLNDDLSNVPSNGSFTSLLQEEDYDYDPEYKINSNSYNDDRKYSNSHSFLIYCRQFNIHEYSALKSIVFAKTHITNPCIINAKISTQPFQENSDLNWEFQWDSHGTIKEYNKSSSDIHPYTAKVILRDTLEEIYPVTMNIEYRKNITLKYLPEKYLFLFNSIYDIIYGCGTMGCSVKKIKKDVFCSFQDIIWILNLMRHFQLVIRVGIKEFLFVHYSFASGCLLQIPANQLHLIYLTKLQKIFEEGNHSISSLNILEPCKFEFTNKQDDNMCAILRNTNYVVYNNIDDAQNNGINLSKDRLGDEIFVPNVLNKFFINNLWPRKEKDYSDNKDDGKIINSNQDIDNFIHDMDESDLLLDNILSSNFMNNLEDNIVDFTDNNLKDKNSINNNLINYSIDKTNKLDNCNSPKYIAIPNDKISNEIEASKFGNKRSLSPVHEEIEQIKKKVKLNFDFTKITNILKTSNINPNNLETKKTNLNVASSNNETNKSMQNKSPLNIMHVGTIKLSSLNQSKLNQQLLNCNNKTYRFEGMKFKKSQINKSTVANSPSQLKIENEKFELQTNSCSSSSNTNSSDESSNDEYLEDTKFDSKSIIEIINATKDPKLTTNLLENDKKMLENIENTLKSLSKEKTELTEKINLNIPQNTDLVVPNINNFNTIKNIYSNNINIKSKTINTKNENLSNQTSTNYSNDFNKSPNISNAIPNVPCTKNLYALHQNSDTKIDNFQESISNSSTIINIDNNLNNVVKGLKFLQPNSKINNQIIIPSTLSTKVDSVESSGSKLDATNNISNFNERTIDNSILLSKSSNIYSITNHSNFNQPNFKFNKFKLIKLHDNTIANSIDKSNCLEPSNQVINSMITVKPTFSSVIHIPQSKDSPLSTLKNVFKMNLSSSETKILKQKSMELEIREKLSQPSNKSNTNNFHVVKLIIPKKQILQVHADDKSSNILVKNEHSFNSDKSEETNKLNDNSSCSLKRLNSAKINEKILQFDGMGDNDIDFINVTHCNDKKDQVVIIQNESNNVVLMLPRPWRYPDGSLNVKSFIHILDEFLRYILIRPNCCIVNLFRQFYPQLMPVIVLELIEILEDLNCVSKNKLKSSHPLRLFSPRSVIYKCEADMDDVDELIIPTIDCQYKLLQFFEQILSIKSLSCDAD